MLCFSVIDVYLIIYTKYENCSSPSQRCRALGTRLGCLRVNPPPNVTNTLRRDVADRRLAPRSFSKTYRVTRRLYLQCSRSSPSRDPGSTRTLKAFCIFFLYTSQRLYGALASVRRYAILKRRQNYFRFGPGARTRRPDGFKILPV